MCRKSVFLHALLFTVKILIFRLHGKNDFAEVSKNLRRYRSENNFVWLSKLFRRTLKHNEQKIWTLATSLSVLRNYSDNVTNLFSDSHLATFFNILAKPFFLCLMKFALSLHFNFCLDYL